MVVSVEFRGLQPLQNRRERGIIGHWSAHLAETAGVPELVAEILAGLDALLGKPDVLPLRRGGNDAETQAIGPVFFNKIERIG